MDGGDGSITITWTDPGDPGVNGYEWQSCDRESNGSSTNCSDWEDATPVQITARSVTISGLTNDQEYNVKLVAMVDNLRSVGTTFGPVTPTATPDADSAPDFGSASVGAQTWVVGTAITAVTLPTATGGDGTAELRADAGHHRLRADPGQ